MTSVVTHASTDRHAEWGGTRRYIRIVIHPDTPSLRKAATRYTGGDFTNAAGCFHPAPDRERYDEERDEWKQVTDPHWAGVLRLSRDSLHTEAVTHECVHAALAIYRMDVAVVPNLGNGCGPREETLAYIVGDLTHSVVNALHAAGVYQ